MSEGDRRGDTKLEPFVPQRTTKRGNCLCGSRAQPGELRRYVRVGVAKECIQQFANRRSTDPAESHHNVKLSFGRGICRRLGARVVAFSPGWLTSSPARFVPRPGWRIEQGFWALSEDRGARSREVGGNDGSAQQGRFWPVHMPRRREAVSIRTIQDLVDAPERRGCVREQDNRYEIGDS